MMLGSSLISGRLKSNVRLARAKAVVEYRSMSYASSESQGFIVVKHVIKDNLDNNKSVVCSPASIDAVLRILAVGAENLTQKQLLELLGNGDVAELNTAATKLSDVLKASDDVDAPEISYVNALWLDQQFSLKDEFEKVLREVHDAYPRVVDFVNQADQVVTEANSWAEQESKGLIKQLLTRNSITRDAALLLANALYFKGSWLHSFESNDTKDDGFNLLDGHKVRVPFMNQWQRSFDYGTFEKCKVIRMMYKTGKSTKRFSMYVFLPHEKDGLPNLVDEIKIDENMFNEQFKLNNTKVNELRIPKFKFESDVPLKETMKQLGLVSPFDEDCEDFTGIIDDPKPLYVTDIMHKCCVETNERGTVATAITWAYSTPGYSPPVGPPPPRIEFIADHPFMFMIRQDTSGVILFVGTMLNPK
ncbi:serpin-Z10-like [Silene latifolia]|uniref:serpin-Z10-like n=1 Tax=Silene latifolia TaxID=37657 RepID=UPI003D772D50